MKTSLSVLCLFLVATGAHSELISLDLNEPGDGLVTRDTRTQLEWLDFSETLHLSYNEIVQMMEPGGRFEGWRYALAPEIESLWTSAGGVPSRYIGWTQDNDGVVARVVAFTGSTRSGLQCPGEVEVFGRTGHVYDHAPNAHYRAVMWDSGLCINAGYDYLYAWSAYVFDDSQSPDTASWLVRDVALAQYSCEGFYPPADNVIVVKKPNRTIPLKMELIDENNIPAWDIEPPVLQLLYSPAISDESLLDATEVTTAGVADDGNLFYFDGTAWHHNLRTKGRASGSYTLKVVAGAADYLIAPTCTMNLIIQ